MPSSRALRVTSAARPPTPRYLQVYNFIRSVVFPEDYLRTPQVEISLRDSTIFARDNPAAGDMIFHRLRGTSTARTVGTEVIPGVFLRDLAWIAETQVKLALFMSERQLGYIRSGALPFLVLSRCGKSQSTQDSAIAVLVCSVGT